MLHSFVHFVLPTHSIVKVLPLGIGRLTCQNCHLAQPTFGKIRAKQGQAVPTDEEKLISYKRETLASKLIPLSLSRFWLKGAYCVSVAYRVNLEC